MNGFNLEQAIKAQAAPDAAGVGEERFESRRRVRALSDEIRVLRSSGMAGEAIASLLATKAEAAINAEAIGRFYVDASASRPEDNRRQ